MTRNNIDVYLDHCIPLYVADTKVEGKMNGLGNRGYFLVPRELRDLGV